jgi:hypothetical protein
MTVNNGSVSANWTQCTLAGSINTGANHGSKRKYLYRSTALEQGQDRRSEDPFKLKEIWAIRVRLQLASRCRELALFNLAIDSKMLDRQEIPEAKTHLVWVGRSI